MRRRFLVIVLILVSSPAALSVAQSEPNHPSLPRIPFDARRAATLQLDGARAFGMASVLSNSIGIKLAFIPGGRFDMGPNGSKQRVTLANPFYLGVTEVTLGQYRKFKPHHLVPGAATEFNQEDRPAAMVSYNDARAFCAWLTEQPVEKAAGRTYGLPTEAQWEWAARAGTESSRYFGDTDKGQAEYSWFNVTYTPNPQHETNGRGRQPVAGLKSNAWGLHDMLGNVWEWCENPRIDDAGLETRDPVMRGGSWRSGAFHCTAVAQDPGDPDLRADHIGFRIACRVVLRTGQDTRSTPAADVVVDLNNAFRDAYARTRKEIIARSGPVIAIEGDQLVLINGSKRSVAKVIPENYHTLKAIAHVPLAIYVTLAHGTDGEISKECRTALRSYRDQIIAAANALKDRGFSDSTFKRQQEILTASNRFLDQLLDGGKTNQAKVVAFARRMAPLVLANATDAARAQLDGLHKQMQAWKTTLTTDEWKALHVVIMGSAAPRRGNVAVQYFSRLLGEKGEGERIIYAEALFDESRAVNLLGTRLMDAQIGSAFFGDRHRMDRDLLADTAEALLKNMPFDP